MGLFHRATITPSKPELVERWLQASEMTTDGARLEHIGAFRFDDPHGEVGIETFLVRADGEVVQVPLTYRSEPLAKAALRFHRSLRPATATPLTLTATSDGQADDVLLAEIARR